MNVLEVQQDKLGAIWMNTTRGLYRYNGHSLEKLSEERPRRSLECTGDDYLYALRQDDILCLDVVNLTSCSIPLEDAPSYFTDIPQSPSLRSSDGRVFSSLGDGGFRVEWTDGSCRDYLHCDGRSINVVRGFVEMEDGTTGLVHISEVASSYVKDVNEYLTVGQEVKVKIVSLDEKGKINLSIKRALTEDKKQNTKITRANDTWTKPSQEPMNFEDMLSKFKQESDEKFSKLDMVKKTSRRAGRK